MKTLVRMAIQPVALLIVALALATPAFGQNNRAQLQLDNLSKLEDKADKIVDITIGPEMMTMVANFLKHGKDPDSEQVRELLSGIKLIVVKSFEFDSPDQFSSADVDSIRSQVRGPGWNRLVGARSKREKETAEVYALMDNGKVQGVVVLVSSATELTVINISGSVDLEKLSKFQDSIEIPGVVLERTDKNDRN